MRYLHTESAIFKKRLNRFIATVRIGEQTQRVHLKNTGRLRELLVPGAEVILDKSENPARKTAYDLIAVYHNGKLFNIDSLAPNRAMGEYLADRGFDEVQPEHVFRDSRIDFYMRRGQQQYLLEVKGCTLEKDGIGYFPDAPTERGVKHLHTLKAAREEGYEAIVAFVTGMDGVTKVLPNDETMPEFGVALREAKAAGVRVFCFSGHPEKDSFVIIKETEQ